MNREQRAHILRAASTIVDDPNILVIGSQSVLATFDEDELPEAASASMEVTLPTSTTPQRTRLTRSTARSASSPHSTR